LTTPVPPTDAYAPDSSCCPNPPSVSSRQDQTPGIAAYLEPLMGVFAMGDLMGVCVCVESKYEMGN